MRSPTLSLLALLFSFSRLFGLGNFTSSYSSFQDASFLSHRFYLYGLEIGKHRLDIEITRTDRQNRIFDQQIKDTGYNLKFNLNPLRFLALNLISTSGANQYQTGSYSAQYENNLLAGELVLYNARFYLRNSVGERVFKTQINPGSGIEEEHEVKGQVQNLLVVGGLTRSSLAPFNNLRGYFSIEPAEELRLDKIGLTFLVNGEKNNVTYPLAQIREAKNLSTVAGTIKLRYPLFNFGSLNFEGATVASDARYRLITSNNIASNNRRLSTNIFLTPTGHTELELDIQRTWTSEAKIAGVGNENRDKKLFNAYFNYTYRRGRLSFKRALTLESILTPNPLNKNDRDILSDRMNLDFQLQILKNLRSQLTGASTNENLIYVERFMSGNTRTNRSYSLDEELEFVLSPLRFTADLSGKADYLFFQFGARRNSYSTIGGLSLTTAYEGNPTLLPKVTIGTSGENYFSHETDRYGLDLGVVKRQIIVSIFYLPSRNFSIIPNFSLSENENYNPFTAAHLPWWDKTGGISFNWKFGNASEFVGDIKNVRRSYAEQNWLVNISVTYHF